MQLAKVIGNTSATVKHESLVGAKLLIVVPLMADGEAVDGFPLIAIDGVGAGIGETVMISSDGHGAREMLGTNATPVRWSIVGRKD